MSNSYYKIEKIGEGTYGVVYKAKEKKTGRIVALKKIRLDNENEGIPITTIREISILKTLRHSTIVSLETIFYKHNKIYLAMEYLELDLRAYIDNIQRGQKTIPINTIKSFVQQILTAISFCHSKAILHRDLKPPNILVSADLKLKLADFGLGRSVGIPLQTYTGDIVTLWYRAPELLLGTKYYSEAVDIWSAGLIICEFITLSPIFKGDSEVDQIYKIFKLLGTPTETVWPNVNELPSFHFDLPKWEPKSLNQILKTDSSFIDLVQKMLVYDPSKRISAKRALNHKFLAGLPPINE